MELYIIKSTACLSVFLLFYKLLLEKEDMHVFKRFYLLAALILAFSIPFITFTSYVFVAPIEEFLQVSAMNDAQTIVEHSTNQTNYISTILWSVYALGVVFFAGIFIKNLSQLFVKINHNTKVKNNKITNVLLLHSIIPHTFFKYIFLNKTDFENKKIPKEVLLHEETHALQKHSIDVLFIEFLQIVFWFNPFIYLIKHAIKLNHEFLADQAVLNRGIETANYQKTLLSFSSGTHQPHLANSINYSFTRLNGLFSKKSFGQVKKRFTIMKTHTSKKAIWLRSLLILPLIALLLFSFSNNIITPQEKATPEQIAEYNTLAKKYNEQINSDSNINIKFKDVKRLKYIYGLMTEAQKKKAEEFPNIPPPPPAPKAPKVNGSENIPPPPPLPPNATAEQKAAVSKYKQKTNGKVPPPPPTPPIPSEHMKELAKKGAVFFYEGKKITPQKAQKIVESNKNIQIQVLDHNTNKPIVKLSSKPYTYKKK